MLTALLSPVFNESGSFMDQLNDWERAVDHSGAVTKDLLGNTLTCAMISGKAPLRIKEFLRLTSVDYSANYEAMRAAIQAYLQKGNHYTGEGTAALADAMDIGMVGKGAGGGKGKGKGKGGGNKGKGA
eukprot:6043083-Heterocapsa_arctica.AAC.1